MLASRRFLPSGEKGRRIRELTSVVQKRFKFKEGSIELYAEKVANKGLCAVAQAESLRYKLLGGLAVRRACYGVLRFVMESKAKGCEVCLPWTGRMWGSQGHYRLADVDVGVMNASLSVYGLGHRAYAISGNASGDRVVAPRMETLSLFPLSFTLCFRHVFVLRMGYQGFHVFVCKISPWSHCAIGHAPSYILSCDARPYRSSSAASCERNVLRP